MPKNLEDIERAVRSIQTTEIVSCPLRPLEITGITAGDAIDSTDVLGSVMELKVPKRGIIVSATFWDLDFEGTQVDLEIFSNNITQVAWDAVWTIGDAEVLNFITEIAFFAFDSHTLSYTSEVKNIGKAYTAPAGKFWIQAVNKSAAATYSIAAGALPRFQLQIQSFDPAFKES